MKFQILGFDYYMHKYKNRSHFVKFTFETFRSLFSSPKTSKLNSLMRGLWASLF